MNESLFASRLLLSAVTLLASSLLLDYPVDASNNIQFSCTRARVQDLDQDKVYTTYVRPQGQAKKPIIHWTQTVGGISPKERCQQITPRLQEAYNQGRLDIITNGTMKGQPVVCTTKAYGGQCDMLLITAVSSNHAIKIAYELKDALSGRNIGPAKQSSASSPVYFQINMDEAIRNAPTE